MHLPIYDLGPIHQLEPKLITHNFNTKSIDISNDDWVAKQRNDFTYYNGIEKGKPLLNDTYAWGLKRGTIEIKKYYKNDEFAIRLFIFNCVNDRNKYDKASFREKNNFDLVINNIAVNSNVLKDKSMSFAYPRNEEISGYVGKWYTFFENENSGKYSNYGNTPYIQMTHLVIHSSDLNLKYSDLNNISLIMNMNDNSKRQNIVELTKREFDNKNISIENNKNINLALNDYLCFKFSEQSQDIITKYKYYRTFNINFHELNQFKPTQKLATINTNHWSSVWSEEQKYWVPGMPTDKNANTMWGNMDHETLYEGYMLYYGIDDMTKANVVPNFGINNFENLAIREINKELKTVSTLKNDIELLDRSADIYYDQKTSYNYDLKTVVNSDKGKEGLIIPYHFDGNFINKYNFFIDIFDNNENQLNISFIQNTKIDKPLLNPINGLIKIEQKYNDKSQPNRQYNYEFDLRNVDSLLTNNFDFNWMENYKC